MAGTTDVTAEDQQKINTFNKRFQRLKEIEAELEGKRNLRADCEDASSELMLVDEEQVRYVLGECFVHATPEEAEEKLQSNGYLQRVQQASWRAGLEEIQQEQQRLEQESSHVKAEMEQLKKVLYGKFGNSINLEE